MKPVTQFRWTIFAVLACSLLLFESFAEAEPVSLKRAVELALAHSTVSAGASNDQQRAFAALREARNQYIPQLVAGSGLGASWGFPLSLEGAAPSIFNINAQSALINPALRDFVRAARTESAAATIQAKDQRQQVTQDVILTYAELVKWEGMLAELTQGYADAQRDQGSIEQRIQEGVDSQMEQQKAKLATARTHLRALQAQGAIAVLQEHLSKLTGLPSASIVTESDSIPALPVVKQEDDLSAKAAESDPALQAAELRAKAQIFRARGEHRSLWPSVDFAAQYAVLARYNNYDQFYKTFERNNATVGVAIRFPFLNFSQRAHAQAADAEAFRAKNDVQSAHNQISEQTLKLQRSVEQLSAAQEVAELEYGLAQSNLETVNVRMNSGTASIHDAADARMDALEKYNALQNSNFELLRARIALLRASGEMESWVQQGK
jgi:outer membrane protein TolC